MMKTVFHALVSLMLVGCTVQPDNYLIKIAGPTQGTTYHISYVVDSATLDVRHSVDSILAVIDQSMSLWLPNSTISRVNRGDSIAVDAHFLFVLKTSLAISKKSNGAFDATISPLVKAWGFGPDERLAIDSARIDSLRKFTGYQKIGIADRHVVLPKGMQLDFNAIAQGYSVDVLAKFLDAKGIRNYLVEVGGEVRARGKNISGTSWTVGVDKPEEHIAEAAQRYQVILGLDSVSLATSGNYRKFWVDEATGIKYAHTIDPKTGYPAKSRLLSASIIAPDCITADAWATACMVVGLEGAKEMILSQPNLEGYLVYSDLEGNMLVWQSEGFAAYER